MKKLIIILLSIHASLFTIHAFAQGCLPEGIAFTTQSQIDSFQVNYPGCTEIEGNVIIWGWGGINNLNGLNALISIGGRLHINNDDLMNLAGLNNLKSIHNDLSVYNSDGLTNMSGLNGLEAIGGDLIIECNYSLSSIASLENLTLIGGGISIGSNSSLISLNGLEGLSTIQQHLTIMHNDQLADLTGLDNLDFVGGNLLIDFNWSLTSLDGLDNLDSIQGSFFLGHIPYYSSFLTGNPSLMDISGLGNLTFIGEKFVICNNDALINLSGLNNLSSVGGDLQIGANDTLNSLSGLENLISVDGNFHIGVIWIGPHVEIYCGNPLLTELLGINNLAFIGGEIIIIGNESLNSLSGLENIPSIAGDLTILNNGLTTLAGLDNIEAGSIENLSIQDNEFLSTCEVQSICDYLSSPNGVVNIYNNAPGCNNSGEIAFNCGISNPCLPYGNYYFYSQTDIDNFPINYVDCSELEGNVTIEGDDIINLNGLNMVTSVGENLRIFATDLLTNLTGLNNLTSIGGDVSVYWNHGLVNLVGLSSVNSIGGSLKFRNNDSLMNLSGLLNLTSLEGDLIIGGYDSIYGNPSLTSLEGLDNLESGSIENLTIENNNSLSTCHVESICNYLASPNGVIAVNNNAPGCNSQQEVEEACLVNVDELSYEDGFTISPNPTSSATHLQFTIYKQGFTICDLFEISGVRIKRLLNEIKIPGTYESEIDLRDLPKGIYFVTLKTNDGMLTRKIIKL